MAAKTRARQFKYTSIASKAQRLAREKGCSWAKKSKRRKSRHKSRRRRSVKKSKRRKSRRRRSRRRSVKKSKHRKSRRRRSRHKSRRRR